MISFLRKAAPQRAANDAPRQPEVLYLTSGLGVAIVQWNDYIAAEAAMRHPIVSRALHKIASSVQQVSWFAEVDPESSKADQSGKARFIEDLNALLRDPNDEMTPAMLRYWLALNYAAYGRTPLRVTHKALDRKMPNGLYTLETRHVLSHKNNRGQVDTYQYGQSDNDKQMFPSYRRWRDEGLTNGFVEVIWRPGLKGYQHKDDQNTPLRSVGLPAQVIRSLLIRAIQTAEGHPNVRYLVTCEKTLTKPQKEALKRHLNEDHGPEGPDAGKVPILQNVGKIDIHTLDNDLSDIHSKMPSDDMARLIFGAFGIPIALAGMGAADGAKFAGNYVESRAAFWEDTIVPDYVSPICQGMTRFICPPGVRISADLDSVPALAKSRITSMKEAEDITFLTTNEKRELFGFGPTTAIPQTAAPTGAAGNNDGDNGDG
jgi:phage portal protein BeeE